MRALLAFGRTDLRNIARDSLLVYVLLLPWLLVALIRLVVPALTDWLAATRSFDLVPLYPLIITFFFLIQIPVSFGVILGLMVLDERDDRTLLALRVTPVPMGGYAAYRIVLAVGLSVVYVLLCTLASGLLPASRLSALVPSALLSSLLAPIVALIMAAFARNKVEGLALMKGAGILFIGPVAAYFIGARWQVLMGMLPSYWAAKAFWQALAGEPAWPYLLVGFGYLSLLIGWLLRRFETRLRAA